MHAPTTSLAQVNTLTGGSGTMAYQGKEDSLLPHGQLWGLGSKGTVRYHEYPGFYEGTQPDRAATESQQQVTLALDPKPFIRPRPDRAVTESQQQVDPRCNMPNPFSRNLSVETFQSKPFSQNLYACSCLIGMTP